MCPGDPATEVAPHADTVASMRPGHMCPGDTGLNAKLVQSLISASMRPGHMCPGDMYSVRSCVGSVSELQ